MAKLMFNNMQIGGSPTSASSVNCEDGSTVEDKLNSLSVELSDKMSKSSGENIIKGDLVISNGDDSPDIIFSTPSYGRTYIDYCNGHFRVFQIKNNETTFPFQICPDGSLYSQKGKIVDASCFSYSNGTLNINI